MEAVLVASILLEPDTATPLPTMAQTSVTGRLERVIFNDESKPFCIIALHTGVAVSGAASAGFFESGITYKFHGRWEPAKNRFAPKFAFSTFTVEGFFSRNAMIKYLVKICPSITEKQATKVVEKYAGSAVETLKNDPRKVASETGLDEARMVECSTALVNDSAFQETKIDLFGMFAGKGFPGKLIGECIEKWGRAAPQFVRKNPFNLLGLPGAGFKRCDKLWTDFRLPPDSLKRQVFCAWQIAKTERNGNTWIKAAELASRLLEMVPAAKPFDCFRLAIRAKKLSKYKDSEGTVWLAERNRATAEDRIVLSIKRIQGDLPPEWPIEQVKCSEREGDGLPSAHQVERLAKAVSGRVGMLCGGPGTGKTHTLAYILKAVIAEYGRSSVAVCAPTGKAAVRAKQSLALAGLDLTTNTIHRLLGIGRSGHDGDGWGFTHVLSNPLPFKFIVVDETSMVDANLMADLLEAVATGAHVLFIGDPHQLQPVGHGAPLRDMIAAGLPYGELTEVRRNAGLIVHACLRIKNGEEAEFADLINLECTPPRNLKFVHAKDERAQVDALKAVLSALTVFNPVWQTQVLCARNKGSEVARKELNAMMQGLLNPGGEGVQGCPFRLGDKIICLKNSMMQVVGLYNSEADEEERKNARNYEKLMESEAGELDGNANKPAEEYIANGEIGRVVAIASGMAVARFSERERLVRIPIGKIVEDDGSDDPEAGSGCNFDLAYAISTHKAQGSEAPLVIVMVDSGATMLCSREWHYTAISRASKACLVIGQRGVFNKQAQKQSGVLRKTFLAEKIGELTSEPAVGEPTHAN